MAGGLGGSGSNGNCTGIFRSGDWALYLDSRALAETEKERAVVYERKRGRDPAFFCGCLYPAVGDEFWDFDDSGAGQPFWDGSDGSVCCRG